LRRFRGRTSSGFRSPQGFYRYEPITPVVLNAGRSYVVVGDSIPPCDKAVNDPDGLVWAPEIRFARAMANSDSRERKHLVSSG